MGVNVVLLRGDPTLSDDWLFALVNNKDVLGIRMLNA